jgi:hypothetical protein
MKSDLGRGLQYGHLGPTADWAIDLICEEVYG